MDTRPEGITRHENIRVRLNEVGQKNLHRLRDLTDALQKDLPWFVGTTVFGSNTKASAVGTSDIDSLFFIDSSLVDDTFVNQYLNENAKRKIIVHGHQRQVSQTNIQRALRREACSIALQNKLRDQTPKYFDGQKGEDIFEHQFGEKGPNIFDVSKDSLDEKVESSLEVLREYPNTFDAMVEGSYYYFTLVYLFSLSLSTKLSEKRKYILDKLSTSKLGEQLFQRIMRTLATYERGGRGEKTFKNFPKTISAARTFYKTHPTKDGF